MEPRSSQMRRKAIAMYHDIKIGTRSLCCSISVVVTAAGQSTPTCGQLCISVVQVNFSATSSDRNAIAVLRGSNLSCSHSSR
eukprot:scaffold142013_cov31-Tisochrysis_lutea.AAC.10